VKVCKGGAVLKRVGMGVGGEGVLGVEEDGVRRVLVSVVVCLERMCGVQWKCREVGCDD
jgi:hypothetical protein